MRRLTFAALAAFAASPLAAQEHRETGAHEHGVGQLDIAVEGSEIAMELRAPGADIVGFEHMAESAEDRAAVEKSIALLEHPLDLFAFPAAAGCAVTTAHAALATEEHDHEEAHDAHEEHAEGAAHADRDEGHETHAETHDAHDDHEEDHALHSEFHADYSLTCANPAAIDRIDFPYFATFPNARELEVQLISDKGSAGFEVERGAPVLDLAGRI